jgi:hypothetical protein
MVKISASCFGDTIPTFGTPRKASPVDMARHSQVNKAKDNKLVLEYAAARVE